MILEYYWICNSIWIYLDLLTESLTLPPVCQELVVRLDAGLWSPADAPPGGRQGAGHRGPWHDRRQRDGQVAGGGHAAVHLWAVWALRRISGCFTSHFDEHHVSSFDSLGFGRWWHGRLFLPDSVQSPSFVRNAPIGLEQQVLHTEAYWTLD